MAAESFGAYHQQNRRAWDRLVDNKSRFAKAADDDEFENPLRTVDGKLNWLPQGVCGRELLCLAAGGGRQSALYAAAGANVTVVDISPKMLELDRLVATERKLKIKTVEASMDSLSMFPDAMFDIIIQPVSTCYVPRILPVFLEAARVCKPGGTYISQHKTPTSLQTNVEGKRGGFSIEQPYYRPQQEPLPAAPKSRLREEGTVEFLHRWEEIVGGICRSGFVVEDLIEPNHARQDAAEGEFGHRCQFVAPYVRIKACRSSVIGHSGQDQDDQASHQAGGLWIPGSS